MSAGDLKDHSRQGNLPSEEKWIARWRLLFASWLSSLEGEGEGEGEALCLQQYWPWL